MTANARTGRSAASLDAPSRLADVSCLIGLKKDAQDELLLLTKAYQAAGDLEMRNRTLHRLQVLFGASLDPECAFCAIGKHAPDATRTR